MDHHFSQVLLKPKSCTLWHFCHSICRYASSLASRFPCKTPSLCHAYDGHGTLELEVDGVPACSHSNPEDSPLKGEKNTAPTCPTFLVGGQEMAGESTEFLLHKCMLQKVQNGWKVLIGLLHPWTTCEYQLISRVSIAKARGAATPSIRHDDYD